MSDPAADWSVPEGAPGRPDDAITALLARVEQTALAVYEAHRLPTRPGHYARSRDNPHWVFVADALTPEERWALALAHPVDAGWRFAARDRLGADSTVPEVAGAARALAAASQLRISLQSRNPAAWRADMEMAIRLGAEWLALQQALDGGDPLVGQINPRIVRPKPSR